MLNSQLSLLLQPIKKNHKKTLSLGILLLLLGTLCEVAGPYIIKHYIDEILIIENQDFSPILYMVFIYILVTVGAAIFRYVQGLAFAYIALHAIADIRLKVFNHVINLPSAWHDQAISGQTLSRITNDTESLKELYVDFLGTFISNLVLIIGILIGMALLDFKLMLIALAMIPIVITMVLFYQKISGPAVNEVRAKRAEQNIHISEAINGMSVLQSMNQTQRYSQKFAQVNDEQYLARMRQIKASGLFLRPAMDFISTIILAGVILVFGHQVLNGSAEIGTLYGFILYLGRFTEPLIEITQRFSIFQTAMVAGKRIQDLLDQKKDQAVSPITKLESADIQVQDLTFSYDGKVPVLSHVNIDIPHGKFIALVGRTGSGKSTFLSLLLGHYPAGAYSILIDGKALDTVSKKVRSSTIGLVPQEPFIKVGTIRDNIIMDRDIQEEDLLSSIQVAQLKPLLNRLPKGLDTVLGEGGENLSSGQKQLIALARALATKPKILILDEATSSLDSETESLIQGSLNQLKGSVTLIVVAHRLSTVRHSDEILVLSHGQIIERGTHRVLMNNDGYYAKLNRYEQQEDALTGIEQQLIF